ncbi:MAG: hypothetical protein HOO98_02525 [Nitrospira sp.]|nr:hypothetical protein [Nitrospira sp.]
MEILIILGIITVSVLLWEITAYSANDGRPGVAVQRTQARVVQVDTRVSDHGLFLSAQTAVLVPSVQDRPLT